MLELPESTAISEQISGVLKERSIISVKAGMTPHGFTFYNGDANAYPELLEGTPFNGCDAFGGIIDLRFGDVHLTVNDGVDIRYAKDLFRNKGGYRVILSAKTLGVPCPVCGSGIVKKAYLGGNVYFCPVCQPE